MEFPKQIMKINDLCNMGFPREMLMEIFRNPRQNFARKMNPLKRNSHIIFETDGLNKWLAEDIKLQGKGRK
nr:MAG TPA: UBA-like domain protein [Caudoviricetes sp.]